MLQKQRKVSTVSNVGANQDATIDLKVGPISYDNVTLDQGGTTFNKTHLGDTQLQINGKPLQSYKNITQQELIQAYYGRDVNTDEVHFDLTRPEFDRYQDRQQFAWGMANVDTFQIITAIGAATAPTLSARAHYTQRPANRDAGIDLQTANRLGLITKVRRFVHAPTGSGDYEIDNIPREGFIMAVHLICATADRINSAEVTVGENVVYDRLTKEKMELVVERAGRVRQANTFHLDWMLQNQLGTQLAVQGESDFRISLDMAAADTIDVYVEYLTDFAGL